MADHGFDIAELERRMNGHSVFAPSYSSTWLYCAGSLIPSIEAEDNAGVDAAYGTVGHGVGEVWLNSGVRPDHLIGTVEEVDEGHEVFLIEIDETMLDYVQEYVDWCVVLPGEHFVERRVDFSRLTPIPNQGGTADHIACEPGVLTVTDLKMGKGVQVFALNNTQARLYALGCFYKYDAKYKFKRIVIRIAQPRLNHFDVWEITHEELLEFAEFVKVRAAAAWKPGAPRTPGEKQCQWCRVRKDCPAIGAYIHAMVDGIFDDLDGELEQDDIVKFIDRLDDEFDDYAVNPAPIESLTLSQKVKIIKYRKVIENWLKSIEDEIEKKLQAGDKVPGYKLVEGRANRIIANPATAASTLELLTDLPEDTFITTSLMSPSQIEEVLVKKAKVRRKDLYFYMSELVAKPRGKPVMAPAHDKRPELIVGDADVFDDLGINDAGDFDNLEDEL